MKVAAIQHDIVWEDAERHRGNVAPLIAQAAGRRRPADRAHRDVRDRVLHAARTHRRGPGRPERAVPGRAGRGSTTRSWSARSPSATRGRPRAATTPSLARPGRRASSATPRSTRSATPASTSTTPPGTQFLTVDGRRRPQVSVFVCYDLRFADEFWALAPTTDLYVVAANWPEPRREHWRRCCGPGPSRTRPTWSASTGSAPAKDLDHPGASTLIDPFGTSRSRVSSAPRSWWPT